MRYSVFIGLTTVLLAACSLNLSAGGELSVRVVADQGGKVTSPDGNVSLEIPPGALDADTEISIISASLDDLPVSLRQLADPAMIYNLQPDGLSFSQPVTVTMDIPSSDFPAPDSEEGIPIYALLTQDLSGDPQSLQELEITVSITEGKGSVSAKLDHFSWVVRQKMNMKVRLEDLDVLDVGDSHQIKSWVINTAAQGGAQVFNIREDFLTSGPIKIETSIPFFSWVDPGENTFNHSTVKCEDPGVGIYTLHVSAKVHTQGGDSSKDKSVAIALDADVTCVAATPTPTPSYTPTPTPTPVEVGLLERGIQLYGANDLEGALIAFANVLEDDPQNKEAYYNIGVIRIDLGDYAAALEAFRQAIAIDPTYDLALYGRALVGVHVGDDLDKQLSSWISFLEHHPQSDEMRTFANREVAYLLVAISIDESETEHGDDVEPTITPPPPSPTEEAPTQEPPQEPTQEEPTPEDG